MTAARLTTDPDGDQSIADSHDQGVAVGPHSLDSQDLVDIQFMHAVEGPNIRVVHEASDSHGSDDGAEQSPRPTMAFAESMADPSGEALLSPAPVKGLPLSTEDAPVLAGPILADEFIGASAKILNEVEAMRLANEGRLRHFTRTDVDKDSQQRGLGLPVDNPEVVRLIGLVRSLYCHSNPLTDLGLPKPRAGAGCCMEHDAIRDLQRRVRKHPLGPWLASIRGVGDKQAGRLLALIRDPYWNDLHDRPRLVSELHSYCGYGDSRLQVRRKGAAGTGAVQWNREARDRGHMIAESLRKQLVKPCAVPDGQSWAEHVDDCVCPVYRHVYDDARRKYAGTVHPEDCRRCGPSGRPAPAGSPRSDAHLVAMSDRLVIKTLLADLWREARRLHAERHPVECLPDPRGEAHDRVERGHDAAHV